MKGFPKLTCHQWNRSRFISTPKKVKFILPQHWRVSKPTLQNETNVCKGKLWYFCFCYVCKGIHSGIPFFLDAGDEGINEKKRLCEGVRTRACCTNWSIPQKNICSSKKLGCRSLLYIVKLRDQCCLFFFQFNLSTKPALATQIHVLQTNHESEILTNSDFWQIKVVRTEHVSKKISTFIQSGFLTNKSRPNPTFTIGQKSWLDKSTVSDHFYWSKVNIALARPAENSMWIFSIRDICT